MALTGRRIKTKRLESDFMLYCTEDANPVRSNWTSCSNLIRTLVIRIKTHRKTLSRYRSHENGVHGERDRLFTEVLPAITRVALESEFVTLIRLSGTILVDGVDIMLDVDREL
jgi:hypothetical protein